MGSCSLVAPQLDRGRALDDASTPDGEGPTRGAQRRSKSERRRMRSAKVGQSVAKGKQSQIAARTCAKMVSIASSAAPDWSATPRCSRSGPSVVLNALSTPPRPYGAPAATSEVLGENVRDAMRTIFVIWMTRALLGLVVGLSCAPAVKAQSPALASSMGVRVGGDGINTRVVIDSNAALTGKITDAGQGRIVLALSGLEGSDEQSGGALGLVKSWRLSPHSDGTRLLLTVTSGAGIRRRFAIPPTQSGKSWRYVIDIGPPVTDAVEISGPPPPVLLAKAVSPEPPLAPVKPHSNRRNREQESSQTVAPAARKVVVIDAGHGGHDPGAQSADANEKDITLAAALELRDRLERTGRYKVVMTRGTDVFIPLETRVQIARRAGADLFIALHADSAGADSSPHGASVYTVSDHGETRVGEVLGRDEWFTHTDGRRGDPEVGRILLDLTQTSTKNRSAIFAGLLVDRLTNRIDLLPRSHRDAGYYVLLAPDVPAVLLEMGFITSPLDEARLTDPIQRAQLMGAVADAIGDYFATQTQLAER